MFSIKKKGDKEKNFKKVTKTRIGQKLNREIKNFPNQNSEENFCVYNINY